MRRYWTILPKKGIGGLLGKICCLLPLPSLALPVPRPPSIPTSRRCTLPSQLGRSAGKSMRTRSSSTGSPMCRRRWRHRKGRRRGTHQKRRYSTYIALGSGRRGRLNIEPILDDIKLNIRVDIAQYRSVLLDCGCMPTCIGRLVQAAAKCAATPPHADAWTHGAALGPGATPARR